MPAGPRPPPRPAHYTLELQRHGNQIPAQSSHTHTHTLMRAPAGGLNAQTGKQEHESAETRPGFMGVCSTPNSSCSSGRGHKSAPRLQLRPAADH